MKTKILEPSPISKCHHGRTNLVDLLLQDVREQIKRLRKDGEDRDSLREDQIFAHCRKILSHDLVRRRLSNLARNISRLELSPWEFLGTLSPRPEPHSCRQRVATPQSLGRFCEDPSPAWQTRLGTAHFCPEPRPGMEPRIHRRDLAVDDPSCLPVGTRIVASGTGKLNARIGHSRLKKGSP
jgi:hypothetical protein